MDKQVQTQPERMIDEKRWRALVGWTHAILPSGVDLRVQCAPSTRALANDQIETQHLLMTRNQALLLAKYLLEVTDQTLPPKRRPSLLGRFWHRAR